MKLVQCKFDGCNDEIARKDCQKHEMICKHRTEVCVCGETILSAEKMEHFEKEITKHLIAMVCFFWFFCLFFFGILFFIKTKTNKKNGTQ